MLMGINKKHYMNIFLDFLSLLYPELCPVCGRALIGGEKVLCTSCFYKLPRTNFHLENTNPLSELFVGRIKLEQMVAFLHFRKGGMVQKLIHQFKYKNRTEIGNIMGEIYANELLLSDWINSIDIIIPIPLHKQKFKKRGFNQSEEFAVGISKILDLPLRIDLLKRIKFSETQTRKSKYKRWENVKDIFEVENSEILENKHVLLIDDVITTGATIEAAASCLMQSSNVQVSAAALAFTAL